MQNRQVGDLLRRNNTSYHFDRTYLPLMAALVGCVVRISVISKRTIHFAVVSVPEPTPPEIVERLSRGIWLPKWLVRAEYFDRLSEEASADVLARIARRRMRQVKPR